MPARPCTIRQIRLEGARTKAFLFFPFSFLHVLTHDEAREVRDMARRIAALLLLEPDLDANYASVKAAAYTWPAK
jgi:hypothetical protein